jgi:hypothetical protein
MIGVSAGGKQRAYRIGGMSRMGQNVINDAVGSVPITVTYCDQRDEVRVFSRVNSNLALDVDCGGYFQGLMLKFDGRYFRQATGCMHSDGDQPGEKVLDFHPHLRTRWREWRETYPTTDVYVGDRRLSVPMRNRKGA